MPVLKRTSAKTGVTAGRDGTKNTFLPGRDRQEHEDSEDQYHLLVRWNKTQSLETFLPKDGRTAWVIRTSGARKAAPHASQVTRGAGI
jgi:hypothetical protein